MRWRSVLVDLTNVASLFLGIVGAVPVTVTILSFAHRWRRVRSVLRYRATGRVDIVISTSLQQMKEDGGKATVMRALSPEGDIMAIESAVTSLSRDYRSKKLITHVSDRVHGRLNDDLLILGSTSANRYCTSFLERFGLGLDSNLKIDVAACYIAIDREGEERLIIDGFDVRRGDNDGLPQRDLVYIACGGNPYNRDRRAIVCAGFTTYGIGAAGEILFSEILHDNNSRARALRSVIRRNGSVFLILECELAQGRLVHWTVLHVVASKEARMARL
jgi:hypothetical protein